jgi:hypothetical protein
VELGGKLERSFTRNGLERRPLTHLNGHRDLSGEPIRANRTAPCQWANRKLFEAVSPSSCDLVSEPVEGSKSSFKQVKRCFTKVSNSKPSARKEYCPKYPLEKMGKIQNFYDPMVFLIS